jgi:hypothetical protein
MIPVLAATVITVAFVAGYVMGVDAQRQWERECAQMGERVKQVTEPADPFERWAELNLSDWRDR